MELHTILLEGQEDADKFLIYRPLAQLAFVGNRAMADLALRIAQPGWSPEMERPAMQNAVEFLQGMGFLDPDPNHPQGLSTSYKSLVLLLTNSCHLRCTYCYAAAGEQVRQQLSIDHARAAVDFMFDHAAAQGLDNVQVSFHGGGEPTFAWQLLQDVTRYVRAKPLHATISLTSNGMWSRQQREWVIANIDSLGISMDGLPDTQNRQRPLASGKQSSPIVMRNLAELDRRGMKYGIRITATAPWHNLPADVEFIFRETSCEAIQVEPAFNTGRGHHQDPEDSQWHLFADAFIQAFEVARRYKRSMLISSMRPGNTVSAFCTAPYDALVVAPGGKIVACYEITSENHPLTSISSFGQIEDGQVKIDEKSRLHLHQLLAERRATCRDCFCYWTCAGDCYSQTFTPNPDGHLVKAHRCQMTRKITEQMLLSLVSDGEGRWDGWRKPDMAFVSSINAQDEELYGD